MVCAERCGRVRGSDVNTPLDNQAELRSKRAPLCEREFANAAASAIRALSEALLYPSSCRGDLETARREMEQASEAARQLDPGTRDGDSNGI